MQLRRSIPFRAPARGNTIEHTAIGGQSAGLRWRRTVSGLGQAWYLVFVLLLFYIFSFIDRQIISLLIEPIKRDLQVSDTHIGLLQGLAFAIFYTLFGIPIGRLADRMNRKSIVVVVASSIAATLLWLARPLFREKIAATANWH